MALGGICKSLPLSIVSVSMIRVQMLSLQGAESILLRPALRDYGGQVAHSGIVKTRTAAPLHYFLNFLLANPANPIKPEPSSSIVAGSETGGGAQTDIS